MTEIIKANGDAGMEESPQEKHYQRHWKAKNRPSPQPVDQGQEGLPPLGKMVFSPDGATVQCHVCGAWFGALNIHIKVHGHNAETYKEAFGLARTLSMLPPQTKAKQRAAALERGQGELGKVYLPHTGEGRPAGQEARLSVRVEASDSRKGIYTRGGNKTRPRPTQE